MPTADDYTAAARRFRAIAEQLVREAGAQRAWDPAGYMGDGPVHTAVDESLGATRTALVDASDHLVTIATVCDRRAEVCAEYRRAMRRYRSLPLIVQLITSAPPRPARWADA